MFRVISVPIIRSTITAVDSHWYVKKVKVNFRIGALQHRSLKAFCALTPKELLHSSLEALHTERYAAPELAKEGAK
jgi:hypothetical protein